MKKLLSFIIVISFVFLLFDTNTVFAYTTDDNRFSYQITKDNEVKITGYYGSESSVVIPSEIDGYPVALIDSYAFDVCSELNSVTIPDSVRYVDEFGFVNCNNLTEITVPCSLDYFDKTGLLSNITYSFEGCKNIKKVTITKGSSAMQDYQTVNLRIGNYDFASSTPWSTSESCTEIVVEEGVTRLGEGAFFGCANLETLSLPASLNEIGNKAITSCKSLKVLNISEDNENFTAVDGVLYSKDKKNLITYPAGIKKTSFSIPNYVENVLSFAFYSCKNLTEINISDSVKNIENGAIQYCDSLINIYVDSNNENFCSINGVLYGIADKSLIYYPYARSDSEYTVAEGTEIIRQYVFRSASNLTNITLPESLRIIEPTSFNGINAKEIVLPKGLESIGSGAFSNENIDSIIVKSYNVDITSSAFKSNQNIYSCSGSSADNYCSGENKPIFHSIGHDFEYTSSINVCTDSGEATKVCKVCGYETTELVSGEGHKYVSETVKPTCTEDGYTKHTCQKCNNVYVDDIIKAEGHVAVKDIGYKASCTKDGLTDGEHCSVCNEVLTPQRVIEALGHDFDSEIIKKANCTESGEIKYNCKVCGYSYNEDIPPNGHSYVKSVVSPTCTQSGYTVYTCACGDSYSADTVEATGHIYSTVCEKQASFSKNGFSRDVCINCGNKINGRGIPSLSSVTLKSNSLVYSGKAVNRQGVKAYDSSDKAVSSKYYTVKYINRGTGKAVKTPYKIGQYKAEVTFSGFYQGRKTLYFSVMPKAPKLKPVKSKNKTLKLRWKKSKSVSGYQILVASDKGFTKNVRKINVKAKKKTRKIKKLKKGRKYYVKIRSYKKVKVDGRNAKMYSSYSKTKRVKCR